MFRLLRFIGRTLIWLACVCCLVVTFVGAGFSVCAFVPQTTDALARLTQDSSTSVYDLSALNEFANAARDYTVDSNDRNELVERIIDIAAESGAQIAGMDADDIKTAMQAATDSEFAQRYIFDNTALDHLDDVFEVVTVARGVIVFCVIASLVLLVILGVFFGRRYVARALIWAGGATIIGFLALGIWAMAAFDALFTWLHGLFFTSGTWVFPASSLLIQIFPENFWIGMGAVWLSVSILCAIVSLVIGLLIRKKR